MKADHQNNEKNIYFDVLGEDKNDIAKANLIQNLQKQDDKKIFLKNLTEE